LQATYNQLNAWSRAYDVRATARNATPAIISGFGSRDRALKQPKDYLLLAYFRMGMTNR
jgi:hypothetical protein